MNEPAAELIGMRGKRGRLTATAAAELVALDVMRAAADAVAAGQPVDGRTVGRRIDELARGEGVDEQLAAAARRVQPLHVLKIVQSWSGGLAKTRHAGMR